MGFFYTTAPHPDSTRRDAADVPPKFIEPPPSLLVVSALTALDQVGWDG